MTDRDWYFGLDAPVWEDSPEHIAILIADTFENSSELLARFTDAQLNQAFWYLVGESGSDLMTALVNADVPLATRLRAIRSFVPLFEQIMAVRCSQHLSHLDEQPANPLNSACYMWWDILPIHGEPENTSRTEFDAEVLRVLARLLSIPHDALRESALHGVSEWYFYYARMKIRSTPFSIPLPFIPLPFMNADRKLAGGTPADPGLRRFMIPVRCDHLWSTVQKTRE